MCLVENKTRCINDSIIELTGGRGLMPAETAFKEQQPG